MVPGTQKVIPRSSKGAPGDPKVASQNIYFFKILRMLAVTQRVRDASLCDCATFAGSDTAMIR